MNSVLFFDFPHQAPVRCGISLASAGSLKPGVDSVARNGFFSAMGVIPEAVQAVAQTHSRIVHVVDTPSFKLPEGDGILTRNQSLVPSVTIADCVPVYIYDPVSGFFGVLHSGWQGTGIIGEAVRCAQTEWGAKPTDIRVFLGPHIHSCCYTVDHERAHFFQSHFGESCVQLDREREDQGSQWPYRLSLAEANRLHCLSVGILPEHFTDSSLCTCCDHRFGSNRREGVGRFTQMTAFIQLV